MGLSSSKGYVSHSHWRIHNAAEAYRNNPETTLEYYRENPEDAPIYPYNSLCIREKFDRTGIWKNPNVDQEELRRDCTDLCKLLSSDQSLIDMVTASQKQQGILG